MGWGKSRSKYGNKITTYNGVKYHSKLEAKHAAELDVLLKAKKIKGWTRQVRVPLNCYSVTVCVYIVDFVVTHKNFIEYIETKGVWTPVAKLKYKIFEAQMKAQQPDAILTVRYK